MTQTSVGSEATSASSSPLAASISLPNHHSKRRWLWSLLASLGIAGAALVWWTWMRKPAAETIAAPAPAVAVETERVESALVKVTSEFVGSLEAQDRVTLRPEVEGRITQVLVESGDRVSVGTPMLQLNPERSQAVVTGAIADIAIARAARNTAQANLLEAEANRDSANAERRLQEVDYSRIQSLVNDGALARRDLDQAARNRDAANAALKAAERRIEASQAQLTEAEASLKRAESNAEVASEDLADYRVLAPINGVVGDLPIKVGDYVGVGDHLTTLVRNQTLELRLEIPVERSRSLRPGLPVELRTDISQAPVTTGSISFISERVADGAQSILVKATFQNPEGLLRDEQFVRATVIWDEADSVLVPTTAISRIGGQNFVFVMEPAAERDRPSSGDRGSATSNGAAGDGTADYIAAQRPVQLGVIEGDRYQVTSGLEAGETIITAGILRLSDGAAVSSEASE